MKRFILIFSILLACGVSQASVSPEILSATKYASQRTGIPDWLLLSIAHVESGFNPYAVNVAGKSYQPKTKEEAYAIIKNAASAGESFDVGVMQVNSLWFKKFNIPYHYGLDLQNSFVMGAEILREEFLRNGNNWLSVGYYHSKVVSKAITYIKQVRGKSRHYKL